MLIAFTAELLGEGTVLAFKSSRPTYALILLVLSVLFLGATFLPFLDSILFPNVDLQRVVSALQGRAAPPLDADAVVQEAKDLLGSLTRAFQVAYYSGVTTQFHLSGSQRPEHIKISQATYIAWFQKRPKAVLVAITVYQSDDGRKAYGISEGNAVTLVRGYLIPIALFGIALVLARRKKSQASGS